MVYKKSLFRWILESNRKLQALLFLMILATVFFRVFPLEMQKRIVNVAIRFKDMNALLFYCGLYISAVVSAGVLKYVINVVQGYIGQKILLKMRNELYDHILSLPLPFFRRTPPGMVISSLTSELSGVGDFLGGALALPAINILSLITFAGYMFYLNPLLAILSVLIYPVEILIIPHLQLRFNRLNMERINVLRSFSNVIGEAISGMHEIHANGSYSIENRKFGRFAQMLFSMRHRMNVLKFGIKFTNNFFQSLGPFILFLVGGYLSIHGRLDLGALVAFLSAYEKLYDPWKELMDYYQDLQDSRVRYQQVMSYFSAEPEFTMQPDGRPPYELQGRIEVQDLVFAVNGNIRLLDQISLSVRPGEQIALVGFSGSGKSTLAMVLGQIYSYNGGHVLMDGRELKTLTKIDVIRNMGYVAQRPFIFDGTVAENILYACESVRTSDSRPNVPDLPGLDRVLDVVLRIGLSDDILRFGLNTVLTRGHPEEFIRKLIDARRVFFERWGEELADSVEFFDIHRYLYHSSIAVNLTFGNPRDETFEVERLPKNPVFREFLRETGLETLLLALGRNMAFQTVYLLRDLHGDYFFFEQSPIPMDQFEYYRELVERMEKTTPADISKKDEDMLLLLALRFTPAQHKMGTLTTSLENQIIGARMRFIEKIAREHPDALTFYQDSEYLYNQSILDNLIFGHPKADHPHAMEYVQQRVVKLVEEESLLADIMQIGLQFDVGSQGDRLSGGQKQKIAIARTLLKNPSILIMDEATASLDNASQARVQQLLESELKGKCTIISVVHRLDTVQGYDRIAVMRAGKIIEQGSYKELMERRGVFHELVTR